MFCLLSPPLLPEFLWEGERWGPEVSLRGGEGWQAACYFQPSGPPNGQDEPGNRGGRAEGELQGALGAQLENTATVFMPLGSWV